MFETENIDELLSEAETEELDDYRVFYFSQNEFEWSEIYDLGLELDAQIVGKEEKSETYFVSINY